MFGRPISPYPVVAPLQYFARIHSPMRKKYVEKTSKVYGSLLIELLDNGLYKPQARESGNVRLTVSMTEKMVKAWENLREHDIIFITGKLTHPSNNPRWLSIKPYAIFPIDCQEYDAGEMGAADREESIAKYEENKKKKAERMEEAERTKPKTDEVPL